MAPLQYTCPQDHWGKDYFTPSFPSPRKKAHTYPWLISLLKQLQLSWDLRLLFRSIWVFLPKLSPRTPPGLGFVQRRYLLLHAQEQWQGQAVQWSPAHAALWPPHGHSVTSLAKFSHKTTSDFYSLQLYKHGVKEAELFISSTVPLFPSHVTATCKSTHENEQTQLLSQIRSGYSMESFGCALAKECTGGNNFSVRVVEMQRMDEGRHQGIIRNAAFLLLQYALATGTIKLAVKWWSDKRI